MSEKHDNVIIKNVIRILITSCYMGDESIMINAIKEVKKHHVDINMLGISGDTPLTTACTYENFIAVKILVKNGADVNVKNVIGIHALHKACSRGNIEIVKLLIKYGADINIVNREGITCIMIACLHNNYNIVKELILNGADLKHKNKFGETAFLMSLTYGCNYTTKMILSTGYNYSEDIKRVNNKTKKFVDTYVKSNEYVIVKNSIYHSLAADIFTLIVLISDEYLRV